MKLIRKSHREHTIADSPDDAAPVVNPMRRSTVRLIAGRVCFATADAIILVLPALLYPAFVVVGLAFAVSMMDQKTVISIAAENLPPPKGTRKHSGRRTTRGRGRARGTIRRFDRRPVLAVYLKSEVTALLVVSYFHRRRRPLRPAKWMRLSLFADLAPASGPRKGRKSILGRDGDAETSSWPWPVSASS